MTRAARLCVLATTFAMLLSPACKRGGSKGGSGGTVITSIFPVYDLTRRVAGDAVDVHMLATPGQSAHEFHPSTKQAKLAAKARVAFVVGLELDGWAEKMVEAGGGEVTVVKLGEQVQIKAVDFDENRVGGHGAHHGGDEHGDEHEDEHEDEHGDKHEHDDGDGDEDEDEGEDGGEGHHHAGKDPHVWLTVPNAIAMVKTIATELSGAWPDKKEVFVENAAKLIEELEALDKEIRKQVGGFKNKRMVTFHGSFGYFAQEYGIEVVAVIEPFPGKQPSAAYLKEVLTAVKARPVTALFTEPQLDRGPAEVLAQEAGLPLKVLDPVGGTEGRDSYEKLMRFNLASLAETMK